MTPIRITASPGSPEEHLPEVETFDLLPVGAGHNVLVHGKPGPLVPVPEGLLFGDLLEVDCDDVDAIAAFEREHGRLGLVVHATADHENEHFPPFVAPKPRAWTSGTRVESESWKRERRAVLHSQYPDQVGPSEQWGFLAGWTEDTEVEDWSMTVRALRACVSHLEHLQDHLKEATLPGGGDLLKRLWRGHGFDVKDANDAQRWFATIVNDRLKPFHELVLVPPWEDKRLWWDRVRLENAFAFQMQNYVKEHASFHRCEDETCGMLFPLHSRGRKRRKFCSPGHAKRQTVRNARRRDKDQRTEVTKKVNDEIRGTATRTKTAKGER